MSVQRCQPLAVTRVGLAAGHVLHVPAIAPPHRQPRGLQHFVAVEPLNPSGFQGHRRDALGFKPVAQGFQLASKGAEDSRRIARHRNVEFFAAHVNGGGLGIEYRQRLPIGARGHLTELASRRVPDRPQKDKPPQRERRANDVTKQNACRRPEPVARAGNSDKIETHQRGNAATLHPPTDGRDASRFRGSKREIFFGRILPPNRTGGIVSK